MEKKLLQFIHRHSLVAPNEKTLIATSGGVDSTVLCHLFYRLKFPFAIAHCNFQLRGKDSVQDEAFVSSLANQFGVAFFTKRFNTMNYAAKNKLSIQEAARNLRYDWLTEMMEEAGCRVIATAHHMDDNVETLFVNLAKGCGLRGLHGILPKRHNIIRPMLFTTKDEIMAFAARENIKFRKDISNDSDKYVRNRIRHHVIPEMKKVNPAFVKNAGTTIELLRQAEALYDFAMSEIKKHIYSTSGNKHLIDIPKLLETPSPVTVLFELLKDYAFNSVQVEQIIAACKGQPGKMFETPYCGLVVDRQYIFFEKHGETNFEHIINSLDNNPIYLNEGRISFRLLDEIPSAFPKDHNTACLDFDKLDFPLKLRHWQPGDSFRPLGMGGSRQKLQDFLTNQKVNRLSKKSIWILEDAGEICWVVGMRIDERYKVSEGTKRCLVAVLEPSNFAG